MKTVIISQARMGSSRLPGKVLKEVLDQPLLKYHVDRLQGVANADQVVVATTDQKADQKIIDWCRVNKVNFFRGSEADVVSRFYECAKEYEAEIIVRVTSDCPLIDPATIEHLVDEFHKRPNLDYLSNTYGERTFPRGMDAEVFRFSALEKAAQAAKGSEREHVTSYIYHHPEKFQLAGVKMKDDQNESQYRWCVDTAEDFKLIQKILEAISSQNPDFSLQDLLALLREHPEWTEINAHIEQKTS